MLAIAASNHPSPLNPSHPSLWIYRLCPASCSLSSSRCIKASTKSANRIMSHHCRLVWKKSTMMTLNHQVKYLARMILDERRPLEQHNVPELKIFNRFISGTPNGVMELKPLPPEMPRNFDSALVDDYVPGHSSEWIAASEKYEMQKMSFWAEQRNMRDVNVQFSIRVPEASNFNDVHGIVNFEETSGTSGRSDVKLSSVNGGNKSIKLSNVNGSDKYPGTAVPSIDHLDGLCRNELPSNWQLQGEKDEILEWNNTDIKKYVEQSSCSASSHATSVQKKNELKAELREALCKIYDKVLIVDNVSTAKEIAHLIVQQYGHLIHACDTEVAKINIKGETPVNHGELTCFSIYSGTEADYGDGKSLIWVDTLDGDGKNTLLQFKSFFENPQIKKVWHNYSFDSHILENYGIKLCGFHADTMHMARLLDSSRRAVGGYSLEALTADRKIMLSTSKGGTGTVSNFIGKTSMKTIFGRQKTKKDGSEGKALVIDPVENLQRNDRKHWICYSAMDSMSTLRLYEGLKEKLSAKTWQPGGVKLGTMLDFYERYWRPFGELLVKMETEGILVDRAYLSEIEKVARAEQHVAANRFREWASTYCSDAKYMNVGGDAQLRTLLFGGMANRKDPNEAIASQRTFQVPNVDEIENGGKAMKKYRNIVLERISPNCMKCDIYTQSGWPSVSADSLRALAGTVSEKESTAEYNTDTSVYGYAYAAFGQGREGAMACHAIDSLCQICSIDSLISNFILPLQGSGISGKDGRVHCSLNINTETGRLSARSPNLQNQPALEKDRYMIRKAFISAPGKSLIVADYGQLELRLLAHLSNCKSMLDAFKAGGDFHSRTAINMYPHVLNAVDKGEVLLEWHPGPGEDKPPVPLLKEVFASERRKAKMINFSIAYGKTPVGLANDLKVSVKEAKETVGLWYKNRQEVLKWQEAQKQSVHKEHCVYTLLGRFRNFPALRNATNSHRNHIERAAINAPVQGSAADVAMCAMLRISENSRLKELGWKLMLQIHDEVILEGPSESAEIAKSIVVDCMSKPFPNGTNILQIDLAVDAKIAQNWYSAK